MDGLEYLYKVKKKKKPKVKKGKKGSFNKTHNNETTFVTKVPKMPKGDINLGAVVKRANKKKGGKSTDIIIRTTSAKIKKKAGLQKTSQIKKESKQSGTGDIIPGPDTGPDSEGSSS